jgi:F0F1-type ATP synthase membrane subunit b/b'
MEIKQKLEEKKALLVNEKNKVEDQLKKIEEEFADVKLNPYGITSIDFGKRQELTADLLKMEGALMGLDLALEICENN